LQRHCLLTYGEEPIFAARKAFRPFRESCAKRYLSPQPLGETPKHSIAQWIIIIPTQIQRKSSKHISLTEKKQLGAEEC
jgi:hypothetical protein